MFDKTGEEKIYIQNNELSGRNEHTCECTMEFVQPLFLNIGSQIQIINHCSHCKSFQTY